ncbi:MAG: hypothetical protein ABTQ32_33905 [Myxococcaceae bacterium]
MMQLANWLERLAERPADDDLRRVVADALSAEGDERGEYMTLSLKRATSGLSATHLKRLTKLFERNREAWLGPLAKVRSDVGQHDGWQVSLERWEHGVPVRLAARLDGSTAGAKEWWTIRELWLLPSNALPTELEHPVTKHLRSVSAFGEAEGFQWSVLLEEYLHSIGREHLLHARTQWPDDELTL